jgi:hypothetical protein
MTANSNELATCLPSGGIQYSYNYFFDIKKKLLEKQKQGKHKGIRYVTAIDKENIHLIKIYLESGIQIKHVTNLPPMSFGVSDKQIAVTIEKMEGGKGVEPAEPIAAIHMPSPSINPFLMSLSLFIAGLGFCLHLFFAANVIPFTIAGVGLALFFGCMLYRSIVEDPGYHIEIDELVPSDHHQGGGS